MTGVTYIPYFVYSFLDVIFDANEQVDRTTRDSFRALLLDSSAMIGMLGVYPPSKSNVPGGAGCGAQALAFNGARAHDSVISANQLMPTRFSEDRGCNHWITFVEGNLSACV